jgi:hypothetical protein
MGLLEIIKRIVSIDIYYPCRDKVKYGHRETAAQAAFEMNHKETTRRRLEPYYCNGCKCWHIGGID